MTTWTCACATWWKPTSSSSWRTSTIRKPFGGRAAPRPREAFLRHWKTKVLGDDTVFVQAVTVDGEVAGNIVAWWDADRRFLGYWLGRPYWGRGIGSRALSLFLEREQNRPLHADPAGGNTGSVRLLEKHGFQRTGIVRHGDSEHVMLVLA